MAVPSDLVYGEHTSNTSNKNDSVSGHAFTNSVSQIRKWSTCSSLPTLIVSFATRIFQASMLLIFVS